MKCRLTLSGAAFLFFYNQRTRLLIVKGAPEDVLNHCDRTELPDAGIRPFSAADRQACADTMRRLGQDGFRVLGVAWKEVAFDREHAGLADETQLVFAGFAAFLDPPKRDAGELIAELVHKGVAIKILTGDSELVTQHVCHTLNIPVTGVLMGSEVAQLDDHALGLRAQQANLFCRVNPVQKNRIIAALRARGQVVGYLGDGINDAPALHSADVGISVDSAVDVAKDAADLILLKHDLRPVSQGVTEGRRTFANIRKYIMMGTSSNFGNMFSMAGASFLLPFLPMLPTQILLNNILYDASEAVLPLDEVDAEEIARPERWSIDSLRRFMLVMGPVSSLFDFITFYVLLKVLQADAALFQTGWFIESLATQTLVVFIIRTKGSPWASRPHPALWATTAAILGVAVILPFTQVGAWFGFVPLSAQYFAILAALVIAYLLLAELTKRAFFRLWQHPRETTRGTRK
jgi:P-type Mg2+ transporter